MNSPPGSLKKYGITEEDIGNREVLKRKLGSEESVRKETKGNRKGVVGRRTGRSEPQNQGKLAKKKNIAIFISEGSREIAAHMWLNRKKEGIIIIIIIITIESDQSQWVAKITFTFFITEEGNNGFCIE